MQNAVSIRWRVHRRYLIFYRVAADRITILHVFNGAVDGDVILSPDG